MLDLGINSASISYEVALEVLGQRRQLSQERLVNNLLLRHLGPAEESDREVILN